MEEKEQSLKKRVLWHSNFSNSKTGFGRHTRAILTYLYLTGKYELFEYCTGFNWSNPEIQRVPWECRGVLPDNNQEVAYLMKDGQMDQGLARLVQYGSHNIDRAIKEFKPDVYIGVEDIWAFTSYWDRKWWNKINPIIHTTLDSLPILPQAVEVAPKIKNYYVWGKFAEEALHELGHEQVKTLHGAVDTNIFYKIDKSKRNELRQNQNISSDTLIIGFVFRNQLRKSVPQLLEGFKLFKQKNPKINPKLLFHTSWEETWDIPRLMEQAKVDKEDVLTTYICRRCRQYEIKPFAGKKKDDIIGRDADCRFCGEKANPHAQKQEDRRGQMTVLPNFGVTESQLNEIYNMMDVYVHPFTSGGQEIPVQEAKLTELITLVTNYACGTEYCTEESGGIPLSWEAYYEGDTQFIKATTKPESIAYQLEKFIKLSSDKKIEMGKLARQFVINNCGVEVIGKAYEEIIDALPIVEWDFDFTEPLKNANYIIPQIEDNEMWLKDIYKNILLMNPPDDMGLKHWMNRLSNGESKDSVYQYFIHVATQDNLKNQENNMIDLFDKDDEGRRILYVMPESIGDCYLSTALFKSIHETYPDYHLYVATKPPYAAIFEGVPFVHKTISYLPNMENEMEMIGIGENKGYVDICLLPFIQTQRQLNYLSDRKIAFDIKD